MLVVIFDDEKNAYEAKSALHRVEDEGAIVIRASAVVATDDYGHVTFKYTDEPGPVGSVAGTAVGALIGLLGGPTGAVVGAASGFTIGGLADLARVDQDFIIDVSRSLEPNKVALIVQVDEDSTTAVDEAMQRLGGVVYRRGMSAMREQRHRKEVAAMKADVAEAFGIRKWKSEIDEAKSDLVQARADARDAEVAREEIAGFGATRDRAHERFDELENKKMADRIEGAREAVETGLDDFEAAIGRASARYTDWDHAREKLIRARLDEARAKLRIWARGSAS